MKFKLEDDNEFVTEFPEYTGLNNCNLRLKKHDWDVRKLNKALVVKQCKKCGKKWMFVND